MKTYAEAQGRPVMDWLKELAEVRIEDRERLARLEALASAWPTCACGNMCDALPRNNSTRPHQRGAPMDSILLEAEIEFMKWVQDMKMSVEDGDELTFEYRRERAIDTFHRIEARAAELLAQMGVSQ